MPRGKNMNKKRSNKKSKSTNDTTRLNPNTYESAYDSEHSSRYPERVYGRPLALLPRLPEIPRPDIDDESELVYIIEDMKKTLEKIRFRSNAHSKLINEYSNLPPAPCMDSKKARLQSWTLLGNEVEENKKDFLELKHGIEVNGVTSKITLGFVEKVIEADHNLIKAQKDVVVAEINELKALTELKALILKVNDLED